MEINNTRPLRALGPKILTDFYLILLICLYAAVTAAAATAAAATAATPDATSDTSVAAPICLSPF